MRASCVRWARLKEPRCLDVGESEKVAELTSLSLELLLANRALEGVRRDVQGKYFPEAEDVMEQPSLEGSAWRRADEGVPG